MTLLKKIGLAASIAAFSGVASAATYDLGTPQYPYDQGSSVNLTVATDGTGYFEDIFNFKSGGDSVINWFAQADDASAVTFDYIDIFTGYDAVGGYGGANWITGFGSTKNGREAYIEETANLILAPYTEYSVMVSGTSNIAGDTYNFTSGPVSAVPEPATLGLMLGGLGMVGFMASRRRKNAQAA